MHGSIQRVPKLRQGDGQGELGQHGGQVMARELLYKLLSQRRVAVRPGERERERERPSHFKMYSAMCYKSLVTFTSEEKVSSFSLSFL